MNGYTKRILATNASSLARMLGMPITIHAGEVMMKALPSDDTCDVLNRAGINPEQEPGIDEPPMASDWKLSHPPGTMVPLSGVNAPIHKTWLTTPDPGFKGETTRTVPFDWEGK